MKTKGSRPRRGETNRQLALLEKLRPLLRASVTPERMLRSVASLLAVEVAPYCIADAVDGTGALRRLDIEHADPGKRDRLRVTAQHTVHDAQGRVARLLASGASELLTRVSASARARSLSDIVLYDKDRAESYMAVTVTVSGAPMAVLTLISTRAARSFVQRDLDFVAAVGDWTGLGVENALRRELQPRTSVVPPPRVAEPDAVRASSPPR